MPQTPAGTGPGLGLILGIESSCDETAAAVVRNGTETLSNVVASQIALHANFGGVVPELASPRTPPQHRPRHPRRHRRSRPHPPGPRRHRRHPRPRSRRRPPRRHHLRQVPRLRPRETPHRRQPSRRPHPRRPHGARLSSAPPSRPANRSSPSSSPAATPTSTSPDRQGREAPGHYRNIGRTVDDAAGEAFDKVAKLLGLGYPGGPWIDRLAPHGNPRAVPFTFSPIKHRHPDPTTGPHFDLSFSGIKTAVLRYTQTHGMQATIEARRPITHPLSPTPDHIRGLIADRTLDPQTLDLLASFQYAVVGNLLKQTFAAAQHFGARAILVSGGVAANSELRRRFTAEANKRALPIAFPTLALSTDNAAMIAAAAWPKLLAGDFAPDDLTATPQLRLG